ncbi:MAG: hypothetical protein DI539_03645 [Flavobacterium psychrophilum]|nr:MAG: hypothetical protein DI539_03645 [Flavobacterium psychrophilum]
MWEPISLKELQAEIHKTEPELKDELLVFWKLIKIEPEKWEEPEYGNEGGGFWVVSVFGKQVIWYNDIEDGFNISPYTAYGKIDEYGAEQDELSWCINKVLMSINEKV